MSLTNSSVGTTTGPTWATNTEANWTTIDTHDHTSGKGVQITPSGININADLEFNANDALELRTVAFDSSASSTSTEDRYCFYSSGGDVYWRNASGTAVQITSGTSVGSGIGNIDDLVAPGQAQYNTTSKAFLWKKDKTASPVEYAKMVFSDVTLYNYSNGNDFVQLKYTGSGASAILTVPDETGTLLSSASSVSDISVISTTASKPDVVFANNANDATGPFLNLKNLRGGSNAGVANDDCGTIQFYGNDAANNNQIFAKVLAEVSDPTSGGEEGKLSLFVAEYDGTNTAGLILTGSSTDGEVDVTIGAGTASITSIAGVLDLGDRNITSVGDIELDSLTAEGSSITISSGWTAASQTCTDLGTVTTADINGGTIDGATIGVSSHTTGKFTTCDATTDFTIGDTVITDGQLADSGDFTFDIEGDLVIDVNGGDVTYKDDGTVFLKISVSGGNTTISNG
jgi:hypothetical protein